jgi:hypothetical protein
MANRKVPHIPMLAHIASVVWISIGALEVIHMFSWFVLVGNYRIDGLPKIGCLPSGPIAGCCPGAVGLPFLICGYRMITGKIADTMGYAIISISFGLMQFVAAIVYGIAGVISQNGPLFLLTAILGLFAISLIVAGILTLASRSAYQVWRRERRKFQARH